MPGTGFFSNILVPTDGSDYSVAAIKLAIRLARVHGARLFFLYVVDKVVLTELTRFGRKSQSEVRFDLEETGRRALTYAERLASDWGIHAEAMMREGAPHSEILSTAKSLNVDLIVIGQVGVRGPRRLLIGSVAERVIESAECPVLVAKR